MANNLKNIKDTAIQGSSVIIQSEINLDFNKLKQEAQIFLTNVVDVYNNGEKYRKHKNGNAELMRLWSIYRDADTSRTLALLQNRFALALDSFLNRHIILTYVDPKGNVALYSELGEMQILEKVGKNAGRANFTSGAWKKADRLADVPAKLRTGTEGDLVELINESTARRAEVYQTAWNRYQKVQKGQMHDTARRRYYIRTGPDSLYFPDTGFSLGEMAEAYANAVVDDNPKITNSNIESSLWTLWYRYISGHKDNVGAILTGDVKIGTDGRLSLAIKGPSASTAKIGQYIVAAYYITTMANLTKQELESYMETMPKINDFAAEIEQQAQDKLFEEILTKVVSSFN